MFYDLLSRFVHQSSDWSDLKRGIEVFQHTSELFNELFQVDSGFFVYKKRIPSEVSESLKIYHPWGIFEGLMRNSKSILDTNIPIIESLLESQSEQWLKNEDIPFDININIKQLGIWKLSSRGKIIGGIVLARSIPKTLGDEKVLSVCAKQVSLILDMLLAWRTADELSRYDSLTGVLNRRGIFDVYKTLISNAERSGSMIVIGLIDIDNFKQINDFDGHPEGDRILLEVAKTLKTTTRTGDLVGRLGGDEFVLIMQTQNQCLQSIRRRIEQLFPESGGIAVSVGFAVWNIDGNDWDTCYKIADQRLYNRKLQKKEHDKTYSF